MTSVLRGTLDQRSEDGFLCAKGELIQGLLVLSRRPISVKLVSEIFYFKISVLR